MIGFKLEGDGEDCDCPEGDGAVGDGCASLTPVDDSVATINAVTRAVLRLRKAGAVYVKVGDVEASFSRAPAKKRR